MIVQTTLLQPKQVGKLKLLPYPRILDEDTDYPTVPARLMTIADNTKWNLSQNKFNDVNIITIFPFITQLSCLHLLLSHNCRSSIIKDIEHIQFTELRELSLTGNRIESVQNLSRTWMPLLNNLLLGYNNITSIRPLKHLAANCQQIQWLNLEQNPILELWEIPLLLSGEMFQFLQLSSQEVKSPKIRDFLQAWRYKLPASFM